MPGKTEAPPRLSALRSPSRKGQKEEGEEETKPYGAAGAAKQTAGEAMCCLTIWLAQPDFLTEGRVRAGAALAPAQRNTGSRNYEAKQLTGSFALQHWLVHCNNRQIAGNPRMWSIRPASMGLMNHFAKPARSC